MKRRVLLGAAAALGAAVLGFLVVSSGVVPIKASSGHWAITAWLLEYAMERSVSTHALGVAVPAELDLDDPALVVRGAGHYDGGCLPCHGSPAGWRQPQIPAEMTPRPPPLASAVAHWSPRELFYIVKHGVKFTGMPAWPARERDDEVWAVVAFLRLLPELDAAGYVRLARGEAAAPAAESAALEPELELPAPPSAPRAIVESCARCHGVDGAGRGVGAFPRLDGQRPEYLYNALRAYASERRPSGIMGPIAAALDPGAWRRLAEHYAAQRSTGASVVLAPESPVAAVLKKKSEGGEASFETAAASEAIARGAFLAAEGVPGSKVPGCEDCHGPSTEPRNPAYPDLAGQHANYLVLQLELFKHGLRGGSPYARLMEKVAPHLTAEQIRDVAAYYASLPRSAP